MATSDQLDAEAGAAAPSPVTPLPEKEPGSGSQDSSNAAPTPATPVVESKEPVPDASGSSTQTTPLAPVTLYDPMGARWLLPFEAVKTWKGLMGFIKEIYFRKVPSWWYEELRKWTNAANHDEDVLAVTKLPDDIVIVGRYWDQLVQPGWQVRLHLDGDSKFVKDFAQSQERAKELEITGGTDKSGDAIETTAKVDGNPTITYAAQLYQRSTSSVPSFLRRTTYSKPLTDLMQASGANQPQSVICEFRNVFLHKSKESASLSPDYANIDSGDYLGALGIEIESMVLLDALKSIIQFQTPGEVRPDIPPSHPDNAATDVNAGIFYYPFIDLYHHMDELLEYQSRERGPKANHSEERNKECNEHIDILLSYLKNQATIGYYKAKSAWEESLPTIAFSSLWLLFKPGTDVYVKEHGTVNAYVVDSVSGIAQPGAKSPSSLNVKVWNLDFDGKTLGRVSKTITIPVFDDVREISTLPVFPVQFHKDKEGAEPLHETLVRRGKVFVSVVKQAVLQEYTGPSSYYLTRTFSQARVIVDHTSRPWETNKEHKHIPAVNEDKQLGSNRRIAECPCASCRFSSEGSLRRLPFDDYDNIPIDSANGLTEHQYSLCYSHVYAYALRDRFWDVVEVRGLKPARMDKDIIKTLVLPPENKRMVQAICETYTDKEERENLFFADNIRGKGEGQIILLHGPPGTGKTLTAESVAEYAGRPLLSITAADLGHEPEDLEKNLLRFFRDANNWDAIVLLDEADVYLERRHVSELRRNSIVSIFLRALDYFQGILFLTTNRVGSFDEAFMSRIHIQIGYEPLDDPSRQQIWMNSFKKLDSNHRNNGRKIEYSYRAKEFVKISPELQKLEWNGREIRNAFQTAVALACYDAKVNKEEVPVVTEDHFDQVVKMSTNFKQYMRSTLTTDDAGYAFAARLRDDTFTANDHGK